MALESKSARSQTAGSSAKNWEMSAVSTSMAFSAAGFATARYCGQAALFTAIKSKVIVGRISLALTTGKERARKGYELGRFWW